MGKTNIIYFQNYKIIIQLPNNYEKINTTIIKPSLHKMAMIYLNPFAVIILSLLVFNLINVLMTIHLGILHKIQMVAVQILI